MKRCQICILPYHTPGISFKDGICSLCNNYRTPKLLGKDKLLEDIDKTLKKHTKNNKYDCIIPISGGRDSIYVLYYAKKLGLNILAVNFDNAFSSQYATKNIENAIRVLNIDLISGGPKSCSLTFLVKQAVHLSPKISPIVSFGLICGGCGFAYKRFVYKIAQEKEIPLIIWGDSQEESSKVIKYEPPGLSLIQKIHPRIFYRRLLYKLEFEKLRKEFNNIYYNGTELHLFDYIEWDRRKILDTITKKLNWQKPPDSPTSWRIDCKIAPLADALMEMAYGVSKIEIGFSNMVRAGKMNREEAIDKIEQLKSLRSDRIKNLCKELGISSAEILNKINNFTKTKTA